MWTQNINKNDNEKQRKIGGSTKKVKLQCNKYFIKDLHTQC